MISSVSALIKFAIIFLVSSYSYADAICRDGWISKSSGSGTCSWHGGVYKYLDKKKTSDKYMEDIYSPSNGVVGKCKGTSQQKKNCRKTRELIRRQMEYIYDASSEKEREKRWVDWFKNLTGSGYRSDEEKRIDEEKLSFIMDLKNKRKINNAS